MKIYLLLALLLVPTSVFASFDTSLKYGSRGTDVTELQDFLITQGCLTVAPTGNFFSMTLSAVKCFQNKNNLPSTGYFGPMSRAVANKLLAQDLASSSAQEIAETGTTSPVSTVGGCNSTSGFSSLTGQPCSVTTKISVASPPVQSGVLCNGMYYSSCTIGSNFVCPSNGEAAYCQAQYQAPTPSPSPSTTPTPAPVPSPTPPPPTAQPLVVTDLVTQNNSTLWLVNANKELDVSKTKFIKGIYNSDRPFYIPNIPDECATQSDGSRKCIDWSNSETLPILVSAINKVGVTGYAYTFTISPLENFRNGSDFVYVVKIYSDDGDVFSTRPISCIGVDTCRTPMGVLRGIPY